MEGQYDLLVVGTGVTSGVASRCREAGWTVAVVDSRPFGEGQEVSGRGNSSRITGHHRYPEGVFRRASTRRKKLPSVTTVAPAPSRQRTLTPSGHGTALSNGS